MKAKAILAICVLAIAGYVGYNFFMKGGADVDRKAIRDSFNAMRVAIMSKNQDAVKNLLSPQFADPKVSEEDLIKILTMRERSAYEANIISINLQGDLGSVFYSRTETRGDADPIKTKISGETWIRDKNNPMVWRLHRLASNDTWFRTAEIPRAIAGKVAVASAERSVLGTLKTGGIGIRSMRSGERYSPVGRRDPFLSLIALTPEEEAKLAESCDPERPRELLEAFDLLSLKLTGVIIADTEQLALVKAPDGKGYSVRLSMYMGKRCGKVISIKSDYIEVREQKRKLGSVPARFETVETILKLRQGEG